MTKDRMFKMMMHSTAMAALLSLPLGTAAVAQSGEAQTDTQQQEQTAQGEQGTGTGETGQAGGAQADTLVATVGDREIRSGEVMTVVGMLPAPLRSQQPEMLVPIALDQLILRELILQKAQQENLSEDSEVQQLVSENAQAQQDDAMVQVWLQREFENRVTDEQIQQTYDQLSAETEVEVPPIEEVRPQIEQHLRQQALGEIRADLMQDADVTFYGPNGQPLEEGQMQQLQTGNQGGQTSGDQSTGGQDQGSGGGSQMNQGGDASSGSSSGSTSESGSDAATSESGGGTSDISGSSSGSSGSNASGSGSGSSN